jgi:hypothetical protein
VLARSPQAPDGTLAECDSERAGIGVTAKPREGQWRLVVGSARSDRLTPGGRLAGSRERARTAIPITHYRIILTKEQPAVTGPHVALR